MAYASKLDKYEFESLYRAYPALGEPEQRYMGELRLYRLGKQKGVAMKLSKITKKQIYDVVKRTIKTFVVAGVAAISTLGMPTKENWKVMAITFGSAGLTAVWNLVIKAFEEDKEE